MGVGIGVLVETGGEAVGVATGIGAGTALAFDNSAIEASRRATVVASVSG